jgi:HlyD family secretion protein
MTFLRQTATETTATKSPDVIGQKVEASAASSINNPIDKPLSARNSLLLGSFAAAALVLGFGSWSVLTEISGAVVSFGQIEVAQSRQVVQHPEGGVVAEILVKDSQAVKAGDLLIQLDGAAVQSELAIIERQLFEVMARSSRLEAERDASAEPVFSVDLLRLSDDRPEVADLIEGQRSLFLARKDSLAKQTAQLGKRGSQIKSQIHGIDAQSNALQEQLALIEQELTDQQALLAKGLAQSSRVLQLERESSRLRGSVGELLAARAVAEGRATELELEVLRLAAVRREEANTELRDIAAKILELTERRGALIEQVERLEIRAPVSGLVMGLQVRTPRSVVRPAEPIMYIIPQDRPLVINTQVATIHIDEVHVGQRVRLVFPAFSSRTTPELYGYVETISPDAFTDERTHSAFYSAEIMLTAEEMDKMKDHVLVPGMPVEAYIETGARSPIAYLLRPFTDYFTHAFRES